MIEWKADPLPVHGYRITDLNDVEIVREVYRQEDAIQIVKEHNAVVFALRSGSGWNLEDWRNWLRFHATITTEREG